MLILRAACHVKAELQLAENSDDDDDEERTVLSQGVCVQFAREPGIGARSLC